MIHFTNFSLRNVAAVLILVFLLVAGGSYATTTLKVENMPDISFPFVAINTTYPASPNDVLEHITKPIEKSIAGLDGIVNMISTSTEHFSQIFLQLEQNKDPEQFKRDIESALSNIQLPQMASKPIVLTQGFSSQPVYYLSVTANEGISQEQLDQIFAEQIEPGFLALKGIDHLDKIGAREAVISIELDAEKLNQYGFTPTQVSQFIKATLATSPVGSVEIEGKAQMVRVAGELNTLSDLKNIKLATPQGLMKLEQLGTIHSIHDFNFISRLDGKPAIAVNLYKTKETNQVQFASDVDQIIEEWNETIPEITVHTVFNGAEEIKKSIFAMLQEGILGAILASLMILLFLRNIRMTFIILVSIPLSLLTSLLLMSFFDISLNIMTLGGLAISIGRVVDDSIVVIENIYTHLAKAQERNESVIKLATKQVSNAITSSTLTTVGVFVPIAFVSGIVGEVFVPFALTLVCALLASLIVALTVIPVLAKIMVMRSKSIKQHDGSPGRITLAYKKMLVWSLNHWIISLVIAAVMLGGTIFAAKDLPQAFLPASESDQNILFDIALPRGTSIEVSNEHVKKLEAFLTEQVDEQGEKQFIFVQTLVGYNWEEEPFPHRTSIMTAVKNGLNAKEILDEYKVKLLDLLPPDSTVGGQVIAIAPESEGGNTFNYTLIGDDIGQLKEASAMVSARMQDFTELVDIKQSIENSKQEIVVTVDQAKAIEHGLTSYQVIESVNSWISQQQLGELKIDELLYRTTVELQKEDKNSVAKIKQLFISTPVGTTVQVQDIADVRMVDAPTSIYREMQQQVISLTAKIVDPDIRGTSEKIKEELDNIQLPHGISREIKGISDDIDKSFREMFIAMIASVFIVYLIMVLAFGNASAPFAILFSLPLAAIGGLLGLIVTKESVNVTSLIGFLMLIGIVVTNAIVLIDRVQQIRREGKPVRDALIEAGMHRLRPIIMTAGATILTLTPLALGFAKGAVISKGLAVVVIGGLTTSTLLTLVIVPIVYERNEKIKTWFRNVFTKHEADHSMQQTM